jgi:hypothetical protein
MSRPIRISRIVGDICKHDADTELALDLKFGDNSILQGNIIRYQEDPPAISLSDHNNNVVILNNKYATDRGHIVGFQVMQQEQQQEQRRHASRTEMTARAAARRLAQQQQEEQAAAVAAENERIQREEDQKKTDEYNHKKHEAAIRREQAKAERLRRREEAAHIKASKNAGRRRANRDDDGGDFDDEYDDDREDDDGVSRNIFVNPDMIRNFNKRLTPQEAAQMRELNELRQHHGRPLDSEMPHPLNAAQQRAFNNNNLYSSGALPQQQQFQGTRNNGFAPPAQSSAVPLQQQQPPLGNFFAQQQFNEGRWQQQHYDPSLHQWQQPTPMSTRISGPGQMIGLMPAAGRRVLEVGPNSFRLAQVPAILKDPHSYLVPMSEADLGMLVGRVKKFYDELSYQCMMINKTWCERAAKHDGFKAVAVISGTVSTLRSCGSWDAMIPILREVYLDAFAALFADWIYFRASKDKSVTNATQMWQRAFSDLRPNDGDAYYQWNRDYVAAAERNNAELRRLSQFADRRGGTSSFRGQRVGGATRAYAPYPAPWQTFKLCHGLPLPWTNGAYHGLVVHLTMDHAKWILPWTPLYCTKMFLDMDKVFLGMVQGKVQLVHDKVQTASPG